VQYYRFYRNILVGKGKEITFMSTEASTPSPARDLVRIHRVITRGIATVIERGDEFRQTGFPDQHLRQGFTDYSRSLATVLDGHHLSEDSILFPAFKVKLPQAPYGKLSENHREIEALLVPVNQALAELSTPAEKNALAQLVDTLRKITEIWAPHIRMEESIFSHEALSEVMTQAEQTQLTVDIGKFSQEYSLPPYLITPFVLFNLNSEDRVVMLSHMPLGIMGDLVMKAWKDQWAAMKPFLLR
jgi:hemerythrin-like domain-containing protein